MKIRLSACQLVTLPSQRRRGAALIITIWVLVALAGLALALGHAVSVEAIAAVDRSAATECDFAVMGGEQFALSAGDNEIEFPGTGVSDANIQYMMGDPNDIHSGMLIGNCRVWIMRPDPVDETNLAFGLTDEGGKLDINYATSAQLLLLPNMLQENVDCLIDWRDADSTPGSQGAEDSYYSALANPYHCKNANFETVEELNLVKSFAIDDSGNDISHLADISNIMYGYDVTHCGCVYNAPAQQAGVIGQSASNRGIYPFITVYGIKASTVPPASTSGTLTATKVADVNSADQTNLRANLTKYLTGANVNQVLQLTAARLGGVPIRGGGRTPTGRFDSIFDWAVSVNLTSAQFSSVFHYVKASPANATAGGGGAGAASTAPTFPQININTAPQQVLATLPSLTDADVQAIQAYLQSHPQPMDPTDISWLLDQASISKAKLTLIGRYITGASSCFSADIVAASLDGRAFKRVRIVIDASSGTSKIIYRRDLTSLGWPLPPEFRPKPDDKGNQ